MVDARRRHIVAGGSVFAALAASGTSYADAVSISSRVPTLDYAAKHSDLTDSAAVVVEQFNGKSRFCPAIYRRFDSEPRHSMKFENRGRWWAIDEPVVNPFMAGAVFDGTSDDTRAWQDTFLLNKPVFFPAGRSRITQQLVRGPFHIFGAPTDGVSSGGSASTLIVDGPGITPFVSATQLTAADFCVEFANRGQIPGTRLEYARALVVAGTIETVGAGLQLEVPAGNLKSKVSPGSTVVISNALTGTDVQANSYEQFDDFLIVSEILSDTRAKLIGKKGTVGRFAKLHIRGNCFASLWGASQPTGVRLERIRSTFCPGYIVMLTGAQQVDISRVYGGGHLGAVGAWPHDGRSFKTGGNYHHVRIEGLMNFAASGGVLHASGLNDSSVRQCQFDPNGAMSNNAINRLFASPIAPYALYSCPSLEFIGNSDEDHCSPSGAYFYNCESITVDKRHSVDIAGSANTYDSCTFISERTVRVNPGEIVKRNYVHVDDRPAFEALRLAAGRDQAGIEISRNGSFGTFARFQTLRDIEMISYILKSNEISRSSQSEFRWDLSSKKFSGWADVDVDVVSALLFDHSVEWFSADGIPTISIGTLDNRTLYADRLSLAVAPGRYLNGTHMQAFRPVAFNAANRGGIAITLNFPSPPAEDASLKCGDVTLYMTVQRFRTAQSNR